MSDRHDPLGNPDATVVRPRPGAGRRGPGEPPRGTPRGGAASGGNRGPSDAVFGGIIGLGLNPLARAATPILLLAGHARETATAPDLTQLRRQAVDELVRFKDRATAAGTPREILRLAHYALCATLDEAVLSTPWGAHSEWARPTLLSELHGDTFGGEKFFEMLERISQDPATYIDLLELQYLCMAVGFAGKLDVAQRGPRGASELTDVRHKTHRHIRSVRDAPNEELSLRWRGLEDRRNPLVRYVPWWVVAAAALALVGVTYTVLAERLRRQAEPVHETVSQLPEVVDVVPAAPVAGPTIRQLLAGEEQGRTVEIQENGGRTIVTPQGDTFFASGSASVNPDYAALLQRIGAAMNQVPGSITIVGHTDDQPVNLARFSSNVELSRRRAESVADIIRPTLTEPNRLLPPNGLGSARPKSDNRAANRRVEIVHARGN